MIKIKKVDKIDFWSDQWIDIYDEEGNVYPAEIDDLKNASIEDGYIRFTDNQSEKIFIEYSSFSQAFKINP